MPRTKISVVIPTILRPQLNRAVRSAAAQIIDDCDVEIIVVADVDSDDPRLSELDLGEVSVLSTGGRKRGGAARNLGVAHATGDWIAFLDDDDEWEPNKLSVQLAAANSSRIPSATIVSCRITTRIQGRHDGFVGPKELIRGETRVEDYLFRNRKPTLGRPSLYTSTLLAPRRIALEAPWNESLPRHQDWDFLLRAQSAGAHVVQVEASLVDIWLNSSDSISASSDWRASLEWARTWRNSWSKRTYADFLAAQTLRYSLQRWSVRGGLSVLAEMVRCGALPHPQSLIMGLGGIVPRKIALSALKRRERTDLHGLSGSR